MKLAASCVLLAVISGCTFAVQHPAVTAGIVGGSIGFTACEVDDAKIGTCGVVGGAGAVFLGGIAALVTIFADTQDHSLPSDEPDSSDQPVIVRHHRAGVSVDAGVDAMPDARELTPSNYPSSMPGDAGVDSP